MKLPKGYTYKASCKESKGRRDVIDEPTCLGQDAENLFRERCLNWEQAVPGYASEYECQQDILINGTSNAPQTLVTTVDCGCGEIPAVLSTEDQIRECDFKNHRYTKNGLDVPWDQCFLEAREGYAYNIYLCKVNINVIVFFPARSL